MQVVTTFQDGVGFGHGRFSCREEAIRFLDRQLFHCSCKYKRRSRAGIGEPRDVPFRFPSTLGRSARIYLD